MIGPFSKRRDRLALVLAVSGACGFWIGISFADWQVSVESAQALAGLVAYPPDNPFFIYHKKIWTVVNQIGALILMTGVSEIALCRFLSGILGMVMMQGWALLVYALSKDALLAIGSPFVLFLGFLSRIARFGVVYPIFLVDTSDTYGVVGLATLVLVAGFIACGWHRAGLFLLGAAPAIHPSLGLWLLVIVALSVAWDAKAWMAALRPALRWFVAGCVLTTVSLAVELALTWDLPPVSAEYGRRFFLAFVTLWDGHRQPASMNTIGVAFNLGACGLAVLWLLFFRHDVPRSARFLLRFAAVTAGVGVAGGFFSWIPPDRLPTWLLVLMPARLLNFNALVFPALLFGLLGAYRERIWSHAIVIALSIRLLTSGPSMVWRWLNRDGAVGPEVQIPLFWSVGAASVALVVCVVLLKRLVVAGRATLVARVAATVLFAAAGVISLDLARRHADEVLATKFRDRTNDAFFLAVASGRGVLLTAGDLHLIQLRTRRPVLLDGGGLDGVAYALEAAGAMDRVMRDAYGVDVFNPPPETFGGGRMPPESHRAMWEQWSADRWKTIGRTFGVTHVMAFHDWRLALPLIANSRRFTLYEIPR